MYVGESIKRREDARFLTGRGTYVDDIDAPNTAYAAIVRSPLAHAQIPNSMPPEPGTCPALSL